MRNGVSRFNQPFDRLRAIGLSLLLMFCAGCDGFFSGNFENGGGDGGASETADLALPPPPDCGALVTCDRRCVNLQTDPLSCGACDRTCVIPNAVSGCQKGECVIASCQQGFFDVDKNLANGCEVESTCVAGSECKTSCGSTGSTACASATASCTPPAETCNGRDDNCDGRCDEGPIADCRIGVHRASGGGGHLYTIDLAAANAAPYKVEFANYFYVYKLQVPGTQPAYSCKKPNGKYFLTSSPNCEGINVVGALFGYWAQGPLCDAVALHRLYNGQYGDHFYTVSDAEKQSAISQYGYMYEGIAGYVFPRP